MLEACVEIDDTMLGPGKDLLSTVLCLKDEVCMMRTHKLRVLLFSMPVHGTY